MTDRIAIVGGVRTPFVRARGVFHHLPPSTLGGVVLRETVARTGIDPKLIEEVYFGIVSPPAEGTNISREALFDSGLPPEIPCTTINRYCSSALEATAGIAAKIAAGQIEIGIAGGVESISSIRALFSAEATDFFSDIAKMKTMGQRLGMLTKFKLSMLAPFAPGIKEPTTGLTMGQSADLMARQYQIARADQDAYALDSHKKAHAGWDKGFFKSHVVGVASPKAGLVEKDTDIRADSTIEKMGQLRPVFYKDGTVTAANASPLTDGASACLLMKESKAKALGLPVLGVIRSYAATAIDLKKEALLIAPAFAIPKALERAGVKWNQLDCIEIHEAFAAQVLSTLKALESPKFGVGPTDRKKINLYGGSIPIGHPFGATGVRCLLQLLHTLRDQKKSLGLVSVCAAGGLGTVMVVEAV